MTRVAIVAAAALVLSMSLEAADPRLLDALRNGDSAAVRAMLQADPDTNVRDESGASALMYAAIYGSVDDVRLLLDRGADVNASNRTGATALMWSAYDTAKMRLLLDRGAAVNLKSTNGTSPLVVATRYGNTEGMRLLLARGANPQADARALAIAAYGREEQEVRDIVAAAGIDLKDAALLTGQLAGAQNMIDVGLTTRLVNAGAVPDQDVRVATFAAPAAGFAAYLGNVDTLQTLLSRGADPNKKGARGVTPLMMAAAGATLSPRPVSLLLEKGAEINATDEGGRTALDWALLHGETDIAKVLRAAGGRALAPPPAAPRPVATARTAGAAIERALAQLQPAGPGFRKGSQCLSCHHMSLPSMAVKLASTRGVRIDQTLVSFPDDVTMAVWTPAREEVLLGRGAVAGFVGNVAYGLLALAEEGVAPNRVTDAITMTLASNQRVDGSWNIGDIRAPLFDSSPIHYTALAIRSLDAYMPPGRRAEADARIARGREFLRGASPWHTQDEAFKLLGLAWSKAPAAEVTQQVTRLRALQRQDGGWGQWPTMAPDAYQTGQVLYALHAAGIAATDPAYRRGAEYLLRTQLDDGTWYVQSRAFAFQPYFETGFPHERNQFISAAATAWASIALAYTMNPPSR